MLTPIFDIIQDEDFVIVRMKVKYVKASDCEFYIWGTEFKFYCKPYFLRLQFPEPLVDDGREKATFDIEKGELLVYLPKLEKGKFFEGLDMLTTLMGIKPGQTTSAGPSIELVKESDTVPNENDEMEEEVEFDWSFPQTLRQEEVVNPLNVVHYGFAKMYSDFFRNLQEELHEILDNQEPDRLRQEEIKTRKAQAEAEAFNIDHYMSDFIMNEEVMEVLAFKTRWVAELEKKAALKGALKAAKAQLVANAAAASASVSGAAEGHKLSVYEIQRLEEEIVPFSDQDKDSMQRLPQKEYLIDDDRQIFLGLLDLILSYAYNYRSTLGDNTVESCWTIAKISSTLAWLEDFTNPKEVAVSATRRMLMFPLYRHYRLAMAAVDDCKAIFKLGKRALLRCLLDIQRLFAKSDCQHYFNRLFVEDYCIWLQTVSRKRIHKMAQEVQAIALTKADLDLDLEAIEELAVEAGQEDAEIGENRLM